MLTKAGVQFIKDKQVMGKVAMLIYNPGFYYESAEVLRNEMGTMAWLNSAL